MANRRNITYAVNREDGLVISRVGSEIAVPILDYVAIGQGGDGFAVGDFRGPVRYRLEKSPITDLRSCWRLFRWTRKIPRRLKNRHRRFWGFKPL